MASRLKLTAFSTMWRYVEGVKPPEQNIKTSEKKKKRKYMQDDTGYCSEDRRKMTTFMEITDEIC